jgi:hypothetical protein
LKLEKKYVVSAPLPACKTCNDTHYLRYNVPFGSPMFGKLMPCPDCNKDTLDKMSGLLENERKLRLSILTTKNRPGTQDMVTAAQSFIAAPRGFLSIHGGFGNGKSTALISIVNECISRGIEARYMSVIELMGWVKAGINSGEKGDSDFSRIEELAGTPVVCLDELDKINNTPYVAQMQTHFFERRYRNADTLGTVVAWNGDWGAITLPWVASRLSMYPVVENTDADMRPNMKD